MATILVSIYAVFHAGWGNIVEKVTTTMGGAGFNPLTNSQYGLTFLIWQVLLWFAVHTCWQTTAMRMFSTKSPEVSKKSHDVDRVSFFWDEACCRCCGESQRSRCSAQAHSIGGIPSAVVNGQQLAPLDAMPAMLANILGRACAASS